MPLALLLWPTMLDLVIWHRPLQAIQLYDNFFKVLFKNTSSVVRTITVNTPHGALYSNFSAVDPFVGVDAGRL